MSRHPHRIPFARADAKADAKAEAGASPGAAAFLEDLIDACVMGSYFREPMAERDLLFHDTVAPHLATYAPEASAAQQRDYLTHLHQTLNAPSHGESMNYEGRMMKRGRLSGVFSYFIIHHSTLLSLLRLTADSSVLLAIIKQEGKVLNLTRRREAAKIRQRKQIDFNLLNSFAASRLRVRNRLQPTSP